jgi:hypothetical protein
MREKAYPDKKRYKQELGFMVNGTIIKHQKSKSLIAGIISNVQTERWSQCYLLDIFTFVEACIAPLESVLVFP